MTAHYCAVPAPWLPHHVALRAVEESWQVVYRPALGARVSALEHGGLLEVAGAVRDPFACRDALRRWLRRRGAECLTVWLVEVAEETGFSFGRVSIRNQRTRWASCSSQGTISLNQKLMLLPRHLVRYVLLHELCHTVHLDHSPSFYASLAAWEPDVRARRRELRSDGSGYVPAWC
jgi:predicted metal-dependent hydrolase